MAERELPADTRGEVWVYAEQEDGSLHEVSLELLSKGRELADKLGIAVLGMRAPAEAACDTQGPPGGQDPVDGRGPAGSC